MKKRMKGCAHLLTSSAHQTLGRVNPGREICREFALHRGVQSHYTRVAYHPSRVNPRRASSKLINKSIHQSVKVFNKPYTSARVVTSIYFPLLIKRLIADRTQLANRHSYSYYIYIEETTRESTNTSIYELTARLKRLDANRRPHIYDVN